MGGLAVSEFWFFAALLGFGFGDFDADVLHGFAGASDVFFGGKMVEGFLLGELDVDGDAVGVFPGFRDEVVGCLGDGFEMDVAAEVVDFAEGFGDLDDLLHGEVSAADDAGAEEEPFDVVPFVEIEGESDDFFGGEASTADVAGATVDAVVAVVEADVGEEDFQERDAAAIGGVGVADAGSAGGADAFSGGGVFSGSA